MTCGASGGEQAASLRPRRHSHVLEDDEDAEGEADVAAQPGDDAQIDDEVPQDQADERDSDEYGLNPEQLWHLQPENWEGAEINSAPPHPVHS